MAVRPEAAATLDVGRSRRPRMAARLTWVAERINLEAPGYRRVHHVPASEGLWSSVRNVETDADRAAPVRDSLGRIPKRRWKARLKALSEL